jgi:hypothetical protein
MGGIAAWRMMNVGVDITPTFRLRLKAKERGTLALKASRIETG